ncbi:MAG: hypothetical protein FJ298_09400 [Planctomycetes bacterium]|nr:hypothetical protein [Planctomycetota bacterium]
MTSLPPTVESEPELENQLELAFRPLHKRCLGVAVGAVVAALVALATGLSILRSPADDYPLSLLANFFFGYEVSWLGAAVGAFWGFWLGFVVGWSFAFARNLTLAITSLCFRARAELEENRGFLDHI